MLAGIRKRLARKQLGIKECEDDDKDDLHANAFTPPTNYIKISQGKIQLVHQPPPPSSPVTTFFPTTPSSPPPPTTQSPCGVATLTSTLSSTATTATLNGYHHTSSTSCNGSESPRDKSQCGSPTFEKELRQQLENMSRVMKSKERRQLQTCRDHKALQTRFARQENLLHALQQENKALLTRIRQYEHCLDDVMRKVVDAIVAEDNLREEVVLLKSRVRDLEAQNAALSASPAKGRDEGYCTMSSGQPQPSNGHLEDLPEEPEQWLLPAEPCSTEMEDWSMSQEELAVITLDESREQQQRRQQLKLSSNSVNGEHDWLWNSNDLLNSTMVETDSVTDNISQLLQQKIIYSEDEEVACTEFTNDFYKLVNIRSNSARSLYSYVDEDTDDEDDDEDEDEEETENDLEDDGNASLSPSHKRLRSKVLKSRQSQPSPTPSEAGRAQVTSCSSSETDDFSHCTTTTNSIHTEIPLHTLEEHEDDEDDDDDDDSSCCEETQTNGDEQHQLNDDHQTHSDIEIEDVIPLDSNLPPPPPPASSLPPIHSPLKNHTNHQRLITEHMTEKECIEQIIKTELSRTPKRHKLMKSQSTIEERETCHILRNQSNSPQHLAPGQVVRSGSVNGNLVAKTTNKYQERLQNANNSWRRSNGWKRVMSPARSPTIVSPKKENNKSNDAKSPPKVIPTRIPSCISPSSLHHSSNNQQTTTKSAAAVASNNISSNQNSSLHQTPAVRKSKIPPPVPVRRSYAS
ncbi:uncharacterized protein isoform X2 [Musca autumnalis]|uniref:uncharacterized protein isoform X2 n=1 Tax=Musca autumnalis TaxID=221902 RepID=UPI003CF543BC